MERQDAKRISLIILAISLSGIVGSAFAAKPARANPKAAKKFQKVIAKYDKNNNGFIDADEVEAIQKAFAVDPALKQFDKNGDGKLDDIEVSAMNPSPKRKKQ